MGGQALLDGALARAGEGRERSADGAHACCVAPCWAAKLLSPRQITTERRILLFPRFKPPRGLKSMEDERNGHSVAASTNSCVIERSAVNSKLIERSGMASSGSWSLELPPTAGPSHVPLGNVRNLPSLLGPELDDRIPDAPTAPALRGAPPLDGRERARRGACDAR